MMASTFEFDKFYNIVNGEKRSSGKQHQGTNPATGEKLWDVPIATKQDLEDAVVAAKSAFTTWSSKPKSERDQCMKDFLEAYKTHQKQLTELLCTETGKPAFWGGGEVEVAKGWFEYPTTLPMPSESEEVEDRTVKYIYKPIGVVGCIVPWNFPAILMGGKLGNSLAAGNTVVMKPSPFTPYFSAKLIEMMQQFFPPGVVNYLNGDDELGPWMTGHPDISKISFTGSTATGKKIMAACAPTLKRLTLELGGNDVAIVLPDADPEFTGREVAMGAFQTTGQVCIATKRIYVHKSIYKPFLQSMVDFTNKLRVSSSDPNSVVGPIQNKMQYDKVKKIFSDVEAQKLKIAAGGSDVGSIPDKGFFLRPTIVDNPPDDSSIVTEEPFGPIVPVLTYEDLDDVIARANNDPTGLGGSVWSKDLDKAQEVADRLETGTVWINSFSSVSPKIYFPPWKQSGVGGEWGKKGLIEMCRCQVQHVFKDPPNFTGTLMPAQ